jgi:alkylation response protein AidB-like acyl-CoA dehydrogenase
MRFAFNSEQEDLRRTLRDWLSSRAALGTTRRDQEAGTPFDPTVWRSMAVEMGLQGVDAPEELGGSGLTAVELALVMETTGEQLYPGPLLPVTGLALGLLLAVPSPQGAVDTLVQEICEGRIVIAAADAATAWIADVPGLRPSVAVVARVAGQGHRLTGSCDFVLQPDAADLFLVLATMPAGGAGLFAVEQACAEVAPRTSIDHTRSAGTVHVRDAPAELLADVSDAVLQRASLRYGVALAAEALGAARSCLSQATHHATSRVQFGSPIGAFEAVKHRLVDALVDIELATSAVYLAACHLADNDVASATASVPMAQWAACEALTRVAGDSVQVHGGMGFTWEHDAQLFVKRAQVLRQLRGGPSEQLGQLYAHGQTMLAL